MQAWVHMLPSRALRTLSLSSAAPPPLPSMTRSFFSNACLTSRATLRAPPQPSTSCRGLRSASYTSRLSRSYFLSHHSGVSPINASRQKCNHVHASTSSISHYSLSAKGTTRSFSISTILKAGRPNWYQGRPIQAVQAGPLKRFQYSFDRKVPKNWLFYGIIGANVVVFLGWQYANSSVSRYRDYAPITFMYRNFAWGLANLTRPWTIITSCFSHADLTHMGVNLLSFYFMGQAALSILTTSQFAMLYLVAGTVGNIAQLLWRPFARDGVTPSFSLGASGATSGVLAFYGAAFPHHKLLLFFVVPAPAWLAVAGIIGYDLYLALLHPHGGIGGAAHLGGAAAGILYYLRLTRRLPF